PAPSLVRSGRRVVILHPTTAAVPPLPRADDRDISTPLGAIVQAALGLELFRTAAHLRRRSRAARAAISGRISTTMASTSSVLGCQYKSEQVELERVFAAMSHLSWRRGLGSEEMVRPS